LHDGETWPFCGGLQVIHTPGHTPGHIALLLQKSNILLCGDAANITDGAWSGANPVFTQDMALAGLSLLKKQEQQPAAAVCYDGGLLKLR
jgi:glyoxylase-like metal-dependent hydrolase (beta-lactamase superfamily II)